MCVECRWFLTAEGGQRHCLKLGHVAGLTGLRSRGQGMQRVTRVYAISEHSAEIVTPFMVVSKNSNPTSKSYNF